MIHPLKKISCLFRPDSLPDPKNKIRVIGALQCMQFNYVTHAIVYNSITLAV